MTWNEIVIGLGEFLESTFTILPALGNIPNVLFILVIFGALVYWMIQLGKYNKEAKANGNIE